MWVTSIASFAVALYYPWTKKTLLKQVICAYVRSKSYGQCYLEQAGKAHTHTQRILDIQPEANTTCGGYFRARIEVRKMPKYNILK